MKLSVALLLFLPALALAPLSYAQTAAEDGAADPHQKLFETKCQKCHSLELVKKAHLTRETVRPIVDRMKSKPGADISQQDADTIYEYLSDYFVIPPAAPAAVPVPVR